MKFFILESSRSWLLSFWMYVFVFAFYLQKPKISETAVQLKQHQLDNSKFPSGETRENSPHKASCLLFLHRDLSEQWSHSKAVHSHTDKEDIEFCFLDFLFLFFFFFFAINVPATMTGRSLILQALYSAEWVLLVHWTTGHCSTHLVRWKMRITHWTSQGDHLHRGLECLIRMEYEDEKKRSTMEKAHLGWAAASCQSHELWFKKKKRERESCVAVNSHSQDSSLCVNSELTWELASLFHRFPMPRQYYCSWKVHYFF